MLLFLSVTGRALDFLSLFFFSGIVFVHCFIIAVWELSSGLKCVTFQCIAIYVENIFKKFVTWGSSSLYRFHWKSSKQRMTLHSPSEDVQGMDIFQYLRLNYKSSWFQNWLLGFVAFSAYPVLKCKCLFISSHFQCHHLTLPWSENL